MEKPMIKVVFFARLRELLDIDEIKYEMNGEESVTVQTIIDYLMSNNTNFNDYMARGNRLMIAVNQQISNQERGLASGDELALFPPVTGG